MNIQAVKTPQELLSEDSDNSFYEFPNFINVKGFFNKSRSRKKLKLLKAVDPILEKMIESDDERVFYISQGMRINSFDQLFIGWIAYYYNFFCFVFTTKRILLVHLKNRTKRGNFIASIEYSDIQKVSSSFGKLKVRFRNGKSLMLASMPGRDRKFLIEFLKTVLPAYSEKDKSLPGVRNLCPGCFSEIADFPVSCSSCHVGFKTPGKAALLSFLMPGLGDLYLGSKFLGVVELLFMALIWFSMISALIEAVSSGENFLVALIPILIFLLIVHGIDALKSFYIGRKGLAFA